MSGPGTRSPGRGAWSPGRGIPRDRGNAPLELVVLAPIVVLLIGLVIAAGRIAVAQAAVDAAARDAARQASISLSAAAARQSAPGSALAALRQDGLRCVPVVGLNLTGLTRPPGAPTQVSATVRCTVRLSDLLVPGLPGARTLWGRFTSPVDRYRERAFVGRSAVRRVR